MVTSPTRRWACWWLCRLLNVGGLASSPPELRECISEFEPPQAWHFAAAALGYSRTRDLSSRCPAPVRLLPHCTWFHIVRDLCSCSNFLFIWVLVCSLPSYNLRGWCLETCSVPVGWCTEVGDKIFLLIHHHRPFERPYHL